MKNAGKKNQRKKPNRVEVRVSVRVYKYKKQREKCDVGEEYGRKIQEFGKRSRGVEAKVLLILALK